MSEIILASRTSSYGKYGEKAAFEYLPQAGIKYVEIGPPPPDKAEERLREVGGYGLEVSSLATGCKILEDDSVLDLINAFESAKRMGVKLVFVSAVAPEPLDWKACARAFKIIGDAAAQAGVVMSIETHPPFAHNALAALTTIQTANYYAIRINFDTANIYYYNQNINAVEELRQIAGYVASVHLKDTNGGYKTWNFPTLGQGVVDYPEVFRILGEKGFKGPYTLEMEGIEGENLTLEQTHQRIVDSVAYLKSHGLV